MSSLSEAFNLPPDFSDAMWVRQRGVPKKLNWIAFAEQSILIR